MKPGIGSSFLATELEVAVDLEITFSKVSRRFAVDIGQVDFSFPGEQCAN